MTGTSIMNASATATILIQRSRFRMFLLLARVGDDGLAAPGADDGIDVGCTAAGKADDHQHSKQQVTKAAFEHDDVLLN